MGKWKQLLSDEEYESGGKPLYMPYGDDPPFQKHSDTSREAAQSIKTKLGKLHLEILNYLTHNPQGATDEQLCDNLVMAANTERPRRRELELMGRVVDSGRRGKTVSGRSAVIWRLV